MSQQQRTLLIVDDSPEDRELYRRYLLRDREYSYTILEARLGLEGLELWQQHQPDAVLLDYQLPDLDGLEFLAQLQPSTQQPCLPVIVVTGQGNEVIAVQAMKAGAQDYIVKEQITPQGLQIAINGAIETVRLRTQLQQRIQRERVVSYITQKIHQSLSLDEILQTTVTEVREFLHTDRVLVFQLKPDGDGTVIAESVGAHWRALLSRTMYDPCLAENYLAWNPSETVNYDPAFVDNYIQRYRQGYVMAIFDIQDSSIAPCHVELLAQFQVKANLVVPIISDDHFWGLLIAHNCATPRRWQPLEIDFLKELAIQVGIAIRQAELYQQAQNELTERKRILEALARREQEFKALVENAPDIISRFNTQLRYVYVNPAIEKVTGISAETIIGKTNPELNLPEEFCRLCDHSLQQVFQTKQETEFECSLTSASQTTHYHTRLVPELASDGSVQSVLSISRNITALKLAKAQLIHDAFHDVLTGLPNRALFMNQLEQALVLTKRRANYIFAVLFLDLDRFKVVNDSLGHTIGDQLLTAVARRLQNCLRAGDTIARIGGDEFTILLDDLKNAHEATSIVEQIHEALTSAFQLSGYEVFTTVSIGIALNKGNYNLPEELLRDADIAMYRAKTLGKARHEIFDSTMYTQVTKLLELEMDLRRAVERQEFEIYYQPIVLLETEKIIGFEALLRWQHPQHGLVFPDSFIPLAEETGLIIPIGYWVLGEACRQMRAWQIQFPADPPLTISVNLSTKQFLQPGLIEQINQIMQETDLEGSNLKLEITESVLMENIQSATFMLLQLQQMNIQLHLDDFGIGYSSLSYLHRFPTNALKIDRSFITKIGANGENSEIIQAIITLAQNLNIDVVAEGVETVEQIAQLRAMKCKYAQGYFFSQPLDSNSVETLVSNSLF